MNYQYTTYDREGTEHVYKLTEQQYKLKTKTILKDEMHNDQQMAEIQSLNDEQVDKLITSNEDLIKFKEDLENKNGR